MERARILASCIDGDGLWFVDNYYGGLFYKKINHSDEVAKCVIDQDELYKDERYIIIDVLHDKKNIILIPNELRFPICMYDTESKTIQCYYIDGISNKINGALCNEKEILLIPSLASDHFLIIDKNSMKVKENKRSIIEERIKGEIWEYCCVNNKYYLPVVFTPYIIEIDESFSRYSLIKLSDNENIASINVCDKIWVLPLQGDYIKSYNPDGDCVEKINLSLNGNRTDYVRIVPVEDNIVLFPNNNKELIIYSNSSKTENRIDLSETVIINSTGNKYEGGFAYWKYYIDDLSINLLPFSNRMIRIEKNTGDYSFIDLFLDDEDIVEKYRTNEIKRGLSKEECSIDLGLFMDMIVGSRSL